jgi:hypothetical protein
MLIHDALVLNEFQDQSKISFLCSKLCNHDFSVRTSNCFKKIDINFMGDQRWSGFFRQPGAGYKC